VSIWSSISHDEDIRALDGDDDASHFRGEGEAVIDIDVATTGFHDEQRLSGRDYLMQSVEWSSDPSRIALEMHRTIDELLKADIAISADRWTTVIDDEWRRKYGEV
jgi:hypothetical protein